MEGLYWYQILAIVILAMGAFIIGLNVWFNRHESRHPDFPIPKTPLMCSIVMLWEKRIDTEQTLGDWFVKSVVSGYPYPDGHEDRISKQKNNNKACDMIYHWLRYCPPDKSIKRFSGDSVVENGNYLILTIRYNFGMRHQMSYAININNGSVYHRFHRPDLDDDGPTAIPWSELN